MPTLRVIGDVYAQIDQADLFTRDARPYLEIIADAAYSIQLGDMGDREHARHYEIQQVIILIPFLVVVIALLQERRRRKPT
jgi:hypothetical protein